MILDNDDDYSNGAVGGFKEINDNINSLDPLTGISVAKITILGVSVDTSYIRTTQNIQISLKMPTSGLFSLGSKSIYLELPYSYAEWIKRSDTVTTANGNCYF